MAVTSETRSGVYGQKYISMLAGNPPYIPSDFFSIATVTLGSSSATVTFSSIPSTYKHLQLRCSYSNLSGDFDKIQFNGDSGTNYKVQRATAMTSTTSGQILNTQAGLVIDRYSTNGQTYTTLKDGCIIDIFNYASTSFNKSVRTVYGHVDADGGYTGMNAGVWLSTAAINSIVFSTNGGNFTTGSKFALYGVN